MDGYTKFKSNSNPNGNGDSDAHANSYSNSYGDGDSNSNSDCDRDPNRHGNFESHFDSTTKGNAAAPYHTAAAPLDCRHAQGRMHDGSKADNIR